MADDPNLYSYGFNSPLNYTDPSGMIGTQIEIDAINGAINALSVSNPKIGQFISVFSSFVNISSGLSKVFGTYVEYEVHAAAVDTGIEGVTYTSVTAKTYKKHKLDSTSTIQMFENENGDSVYVTTITDKDGNKTQNYSVKKADGTFEVQNQDISYNENTPDQKNLIAVEAFVSDPENPDMQALMLCVNNDGVFAGFLGSTLPQGGQRNSDGTYSTQSGKIINEGTYSMYSHYHGGTQWSYSAIQLGNQGYPTRIPAVNSEGVSRSAGGVNIHSGQASGRASSACQNIAPKADYFTIDANYSLTTHQVNPTSRNPVGRSQSIQTMRDSWPTWVAFNHLMEIDNSTTWENERTKEIERGGTFMGYYYLNRI